MIDQYALASDWDAFLDLFIDDLVVMPPNSPAIKGRAAFREFIITAGFTMTEAKFDFAEIEGSGDVAYATASYTETYTLPGEDQPIDDQGKILAVLRRQGEGGWRLTHWIWNTDLPLTG